MIEIIVALITGVASVVAVMFTNHSSNQKVNHQIEVSQAVTNAKIEELTREVREHNNFAKRMPVVEEQVRIMNNRLDDLEKYHKQKQ
jgi:hypothetical protein